MQSVSQHSQVTQLSGLPQLHLLQLHSLLQHSQLLYKLSNVILKPLISFNVRQTKYLRVNSQVFGIILLIICYFLLAVHSVALDAQLSAEDKLLPYPFLSSLNFKNLNSLDWLHFKISNPKPKLRSTIEAKLPLFVLNSH